MPYNVGELIRDRSDIVSIRESNTVTEALSIMIEHDYSQLPVVSEEGRLLGIVNSETIVRFLKSTDAKTSEIRVMDVRRKASVCTPEDTLSEATERLASSGSVIVVDNDEKVIGIVTNYDTSLYFQRRASNMMLVEDIETNLRIIVEAVYPDPANGKENEDLSNAIRKVATRSDERKRFDVAVLNYLKQLNPPIESLETGVADESYQIVLKGQRIAKKLSDLTFSEMSSLFLSDEVWTKFSDVVKTSKSVVRTMLDKTREIRNILFHFKEELKPEEQDTLKNCSDWLTNHQTLISQKLSALTTPETKETTDIYEFPDIPDDVIAEITLETSTKKSKYARLSYYLDRFAPNRSQLLLSFSQIEQIIGESLPPSAYSHTSWWANDYTSHVQSKEWLAVGWRMKFVDFDQKVVMFEKAKKIAIRMTNRAANQIITE